MSEVVKEKMPPSSGTPHHDDFISKHAVGGFVHHSNIYSKEAAGHKKHRDHIVDNFKDK